MLMVQFGGKEHPRWLPTTRGCDGVCTYSARVAGMYDFVSGKEQTDV